MARKKNYDNIVKAFDAWLYTRKGTSNKNKATQTVHDRLVNDLKGSIAFVRENGSTLEFTSTDPRKKDKSLSEDGSTSVYRVWSNRGNTSDRTKWKFVFQMPEEVMNMRTSKRSVSGSGAKKRATNKKSSGRSGG